MGIEDNKQPEDELLLTNVVDDDGEQHEPLEEIEYPETLDDADGEPETPLIKQLREQRKEDARKLREKDREIEQMRNRKPVVRTERPSLESCEWDEDKLADELFAWKENERAADQAERQPIDNSRNEAAQAWQSELQTYKANAVKLAKPDFEQAEKAVVSTLTDAQQSTIVMAAKDPARFIYALGRSPVRLGQLAEITNPIKLAAEVARIEGARVMARKEPPNIDEPLRGSARLSTPPSGDDKAAKLLAAAEKDPSKFPAYRAHMREQRAKAA